MSKLGITKSAEPLDWCGWPLAVPTVIVGAVGSKLIVGVFFEKYNILAQEYMIAVWYLLRCANTYFLKCIQVLGIRMSAVVPLGSLPAFVPTFL